MNGSGEKPVYEERDPKVIALDYKFMATQNKRRHAYYGEYACVPFVCPVAEFDALNGGNIWS